MNKSEQIANWLCGLGPRPELALFWDIKPVTKKVIKIKGEN